MLDCVGGALFEPALTSLREGGRHMVIVSKGMRRVSFDLTDFYHNKSHLIGVDSLKLTGPEIAAIMDQLRPGFAAGFCGRSMSRPGLWRARSRPMSRRSATARARSTFCCRDNDSPTAADRLMNKERLRRSAMA